MATVIGSGLEHRPHKSLHEAIHGHDQIVAVIAEHAAERARELEARREEADHAELPGGAAGPGTV
jgi:hypothetical protein